MLRSLCLACALALSGAFYLPGVAPREYVVGENVTIKVNSLKSIKTAIPYDYYNLMFCRPIGSSGKIKHDPENLGEILWGESIKPSRFMAQMKTDVSCAKICTTYSRGELESGKELTEKEAKKQTGKRTPIRKLKQRIDEEYRGHLILDNLPVSEVYIWEKLHQDKFYKRGFPLGVPANRSSPSLVNNHLSFTIKYHKPASTNVPGYRIVGFHVHAYSVDSSIIDSQCDESKDWEPWKYPQQQVLYTDPKLKKKWAKQRADAVKKGKRVDVPDPALVPDDTRKISWSYSVRWEEDLDTAWATRWDQYFASADSAEATIHWFSIIISLLVVCVLTVVVANIMLRVLHRDFNRYNNPDNEFESKEESGWKKVHGDVFREPPHPRLLSMYLGMSVQLLTMSCMTAFFACLGFLSPANRGALLTAMLVLYILSGTVGGAVTGWAGRMFHEAQVSFKLPLMTAMVVPGQVFLVFLTINIGMRINQASNAVPFTTLFGLVSLWFLVSTPLTFVGSLLTMKRQPHTHPCATTTNPLPIPPSPWFVRSYLVIPFCGFIPFMACFIELSFILSSLWLNKFYYVFGFLAMVFVILVMTCAMTSLVATYFQLCFEDYRWWWRSFLGTGSSGLILFLYSAYYFATALDIKRFWSAVLYFGYMAVISYLFGIMTGGVGFFASFFFVERIYSSIKIA